MIRNIKWDFISILKYSILSQLKIESFFSFPSSAQIPTQSREFFRCWGKLDMRTMATLPLSFIFLSWLDIHLKRAENGMFFGIVVVLLLFLEGSNFLACVFLTAKLLPWVQCSGEGQGRCVLIEKVGKSGRNWIYFVDTSVTHFPRVDTSWSVLPQLCCLFLVPSLSCHVLTYVYNLQYYRRLVGWKEFGLDTSFQLNFVPLGI